MGYPAAFLKQIVGRHNVFGVIIFDVLQRPVLAVFRLSVANCIGNLDIGIRKICIAEDEVAFELSYPSDAYRVIMASCVDIDNIFKYRTVVDTVVGVLCKKRS